MQAVGSMKATGAALPDQLLQDDQQVVGGLDQEGVVIKGDVRRPRRCCQ